MLYCCRSLLQYSQLFVVHGLSIEMLPLLSDSQLQELGIKDAQDRKKILAVFKTMPPPSLRSKHSVSTSFVLSVLLHCISVYGLCVPSVNSLRSLTDHIWTKKKQEGPNSQELVLPIWQSV